MVSSSRLTSPRLSIAGPMYPAWNAVETSEADKAAAEAHRGSVTSNKSSASKKSLSNLHMPHSMGAKLRIAVPTTSPRGSVSGPMTTASVEAAAAEAERNQGFWHRLGREFKPLPDWKTYQQ